MAIENNRITFTYALSKILYACRYIGGVPADPFLAWNATTNDWTQLTELAGGTVAIYYADVQKGKFDIVEEDPASTFTTLSPFVGFHFSSSDLENHINDADAVVRHEHDAIVIVAADQGRLGTTLDTALDNITGATWDKDLDDNLKEHLDDATGAHAATAISHTIGALTEVGAILTDHETRIDALETGAAAIPTNIDDISGEIGMDLYWDEQDIVGIEYYVKFLWKHSYESVPTLPNLTHQSRIGSPFFNVNYGTRRFDIGINTDTDLILYYAIGAKGRADAAISWSTLQQTGVIIPTYVQEQIVTLDSISLTNYLGNIKGSELIDSDEDFPTCSGETADVPDDNYLVWSPMDDITIKEIKVRSGTSMSGTATIKYSTGAANGNFTVSDATKQGTETLMSLNVDDGSDLQIWSLDPKGIGHYTIQIKFEVRS